MIYSKNNIKICLAKAEADYVSWRDTLASKGFRTISLSIAPAAAIGNIPDFYTAVMVKNDPPFAGRSFPRLTQAELVSKIAELKQAPEPFHPYIVSASGHGGNVRYAAAFRKMAEAPVVDLDMTADAYKTKNGEQRVAGRMPLWIDSFGTAGDIRYCSIWVPNPDRIAWSTQALNDKGEKRQQRFDALTGIGARLAITSMTPDAGQARLYVDTKLKHAWAAKPNLTVSQMEAEMATQAKNGLFPVQIGSGLVDGGFRVSAVFAKSDEILPRTFRIKGPSPTGLDAANKAKAAKLDAWMETYVKAHGIRGAAMAVVEGTRLVYAKGYTHAETGYADIEPTTLFRMASVSKTFCAVAAWKALADDPNASRNTRMQEILKLKQRNGQPPADGDFAQITVRQLLENNSGIDQSAFRGIMRDLKDSTASPRPTLPTPIGTLLSMIAERLTPSDPGQTPAYGRTDYILLGEVARTLSGTASFDAALKKLVLDPLKMTRTRSSKSRFEDRKSDEAVHHLPDLKTTTSAMHSDRRIVPEQYGDENCDIFDGAGGVSTAMVDLARLCAMMSCRTANPIFSPATLVDWLSDAVASETAHGGHAHHGFDNASGSDPTFKVSKGGGLPGVGSGLYGSTGQYFIVIARNGEKVEDPALPVNWNTELYDLAKDVDWKGHDMFPQFGMPALAP